MRAAQRAGWRYRPLVRAEHRAGLSSKLAPPRRVVARARRSRAAAARTAAGTGVAGPGPRTGRRGGCPRAVRAAVGPAPGGARRGGRPVGRRWRKGGARGGLPGWVLVGVWAGAGGG